MLIKCIATASTIAMLTACDGDAANSAEKFSSPDAAESTFSYEWREINEQVTDDESPVGYREVDVRYPYFSSAKPDHGMERLNKQVADLREKYTCPDLGDQTFTVDIKSVSSQLVSLTYEAMWYCPNMARPDSRSGVINFEINDG